MKQPSATGALSRLRAARNQPETLVPTLRELLAHPNPLVVLEAVAAVREEMLTELAEELVTVFRRALQQGDPGCELMLAAVGALAAIEHDAMEVFVTGLRHVRMERRPGGSVDVAGPLRGLCAQALLRTTHPEAMLLVLPTLLDAEDTARVGAVRALGDAGTSEAELLLRYKLLQGDKVVEVVAEVMSALMHLAPQRSLPLIAEKLQADQQVRQRSTSDDPRGDRMTVTEAAALALGESRQAEAFEPLRAAWRREANPTIRRTLLTAVALLRREEAVEFLSGLVEIAKEYDAADALLALALLRHDDALRASMESLVRRRGLRLLDSAWEKEWVG